MNNTIFDALNWRYAVQDFDQNKPLKEDIFNAILESGRLAPSSDGFEPWKFIVVNNPAIRQKIRDAAYDQKKVTEAPYLVVITYRTDGENLPEENVDRAIATGNKTKDELTARLEYLKGSIAAKKGANYEPWAKAQTYIPLGIMLQTAALLGVDAGPMEGFDNAKVDEILNLAQGHLKSATLVTFGYRAVEPKRPKVRQSFDEVVRHVN